IMTLRRLYALYQENRDLISIGAYQPGNNLEADKAIALWPAVQEFLRQDANTAFNREESLLALSSLAGAAMADSTGVE
ncbi:MAG: hypothetical protein AAFQ99_05320, partial [Pseudomonadota bacterium]